MDLSKETTVFISIDDVQERFEAVDLQIWLVSVPFGSRRIQNTRHRFFVRMKVAFATGCSIVSFGFCQSGRISKISTLCPEILYPMSSSDLMCGGGRRRSMNFARSRSQRFLSRSVNATDRLEQVTPNESVEKVCYEAGCLSPIGLLGLELCWWCCSVGGWLQR